MARIFSILLILAMAVQIIRPLGLPGLRRRGDFWKIAVFALVLVAATAMIQPQ